MFPLSPSHGFKPFFFVSLISQSRVQIVFLVSHIEIHGFKPVFLVSRFIQSRVQTVSTSFLRSFFIKQIPKIYPLHSKSYLKAIFLRFFPRSGKKMGSVPAGRPARVSVTKVCIFLAPTHQSFGPPRGPTPLRAAVQGGAL